MRRQLIVNATLVALALGTLAAVWATRNTPTTANQLAREGKLFTTWDRDALTRVVLRRAGQELELIKDKAVPGGFRITKPWAEPADAATISALLGSLDLASAVRPASEVSRDTAGLTPPSLEIRLEMAGNSQTLTLGGPAPAPEGARYVEVVSQSGAATRSVISKGVVTELDLPLSKFRETRLFEYGRGELAKLRIESPAAKVELEQRTPGVFFWQSGGGAELTNPDTLERVLTALSRFSSEDLVEPDAARAALGQEPVRISVELKDKAKSPLTFSLGGQCGAAAGQVFLLRERPGQAARAGCIPVELQEALSVTPESLAWSRPFTARLDQLEELRIARGGQRLEMARKGSAFLLRAPSAGEVPLEPGNQRLAALLGASGRIERKPQLAALGLEPPAGDVVIQTAAADQQSSTTERVLVGKPQADGTLCLKRESDGVVLCVASEAARAFETDASLLRSLELWSFAASDVTSVSITTGAVEQRVRRTAEGGFELEKPPGFRHDGALVLDLVQKLGSLRAERWISARTEQSHGLAQPRTRVRVQLTRGAEPRKLTIGESTGDGFFATLSPDPGVFVLSRATVFELEQLLLERALCPFPVAELRRIELRSAQKRLLLERRDEVWQASGLSAERARELGETLAALRAEVALHVGAERPEEGLAAPTLAVTFTGARDEARRLRIGASSNSPGQSQVFARLDGVDATFALSGSTASALRSF
jgi:hypothetical protein